MVTGEQKECSSTARLPQVFLSVAAVNRWVAGSSPARGAKLLNKLVHYAKD
jgi:hypothetical protein